MFPLLLCLSKDIPYGRYRLTLFSIIPLKQVESSLVCTLGYFKPSKYRSPVLGGRGV